MILRRHPPLIKIGYLKKKKMPWSGVKHLKGPIFLCLIGRFALLPSALLAEFINIETKRDKLGLAQTMSYRRDCLIRGVRL